MTTTYSAVYEGGVVRPTTPLPIPDGTAVQVVVSAPATPEPPFDPLAWKKILAEIADLPDEPGGDPSVTARDHDKVLYGGPNGAR